MHLMIQFSMLNPFQGASHVESAYAERPVCSFALKWRDMLEGHAECGFLSGYGKRPVVQNGKVAGVGNGSGHEIKAKASSADKWTYLNGVIK
jgi:hypothetical protein